MNIEEFFGPETPSNFVGALVMRDHKGMPQWPGRYVNVVSWCELRGGVCVGLVSKNGFNKFVTAKLPKRPTSQRLIQANELIGVIAGCGRRFFENDGVISKFKISHPDLLFFDSGSGMTMNCKDFTLKAWHLHFTNGGTLQYLVECLAHYIFYGHQLPDKILGPWPTALCNGDLWGYGTDMHLVRAAARKNGLIDNGETPTIQTP